jgi:hypothetical protein
MKKQMFYIFFGLFILTISMAGFAQGLVIANDAREEALTFNSAVSGETFNISDSAGTWYLYGAFIEEGGGGTIRGTVVFDSSGNITGGSYTRSDGTVASLTGGSVTIGSTGVLSGSASTNIGVTVIIESGKMDSSKTIMSFVEIDNSGGHGFIVGIKEIEAEPTCAYSISPTSQSFAASGGTGSVSVTTQSGCSWTAVSNASWITITSGSSSTGSGTVNYSVAANTSTSSRSGTMTIAGQTFTVNQAGAGKNTLNDTTEFVKQQYRDFLNREADSAGLQYWVNRIDSGAMTRAQVIESFFWSEEFGGRIAPIVRLYFAYFLRIPDYAGLMSWINAYNSGGSLGAISDSFAGSEEFQQRYGSLSNEAFVNLVYQNVLGRAPEPGGYAYWVGELNLGRRTRGQVMSQFSESTEYEANSSNEVFVTMMYVGMLRRSPEQGGFDYWVNYLDSGNSGLGLIDGLLNSTEYANRF